MSTATLPSDQATRDLVELFDGLEGSARKQAYRRLALTWHPDKGGSSEKFQLLKDAYDGTLRLPAPSRVYTTTTFTYKPPARNGCLIPGCIGGLFSDGMCADHYIEVFTKAYAYRPTTAGRSCRAEGCTYPPAFDGTGYCTAHPSKPKVNTVRVHGWVTENGSRLHQSRDCSHLRRAKRVMKFTQDIPVDSFYSYACSTCLPAGDEW